MGNTYGSSLEGCSLIQGWPQKEVTHAEQILRIASGREQVSVVSVS